MKLPNLVTVLRLHSWRCSSGSGQIPERVDGVVKHAASEPSGVCVLTTDVVTPQYDDDGPVGSDDLSAGAVTKAGCRARDLPSKTTGGCQG